MYCFFPLTSITPVRADKWSVDSTVFQSFSYDDNIRMREKELTASAIYKLIPTINFAHSTDNTLLSANASYGIERFADAKQFDRDIQNYGISGLYNTQRSTWGIDAVYSVVPLRDNATTDIGNFGTTAEATTRSVSPSISYQLTELDNFRISTTISETTFDQGDSNNFSDRENRDISLSWSRQWTYRYSGGISIFYSNFDSSNDQDFLSTSSTINTTGLNVFSTYLISEKWNLDGQVGIRMTKSETETKFNPGLQKINQTSNSNGFLMDTTLSYTGENLSANVRFNKELVPSSNGSLNDQSSVSSRLTHKITSRLSTNMYLSYQLTESASTNNSRERTNFTVSPSARWNITPEWLVSAKYRYRTQEVTGGSTTSYSRFKSIYVDSSIQLARIKYCSISYRFFKI